MPSMYDAILVRGQMRYRLNKVFIGEDKVPANVKEVLTSDNIVDENGLIIVDQKNEAAQKPTEENQEELENKNTLPRVDGDAKDETPANTESDNADGDEATSPEPAPTAPPVVDDSANEDASENQNQTPEEKGDEDASTPTDGSGSEDQELPSEPTSPAPAPTPAPPAEEPKKPVRSRAKTATATRVDKFKSKVPQSAPGMGFPRKNGKTVDIFDLTTPHTHTKLVGGHAVPLSQESFRSRNEGEIVARLKELGFEIVDYNELERQQANAGVPAGPTGLLLEDEETDEDIQLG